MEQTTIVSLEEISSLIREVRESGKTFDEFIAEEIAESVGSVGHLLRLKRTRIGEYRWEDAIACAALDETYFPEERISRLAEA